MPRTAVTVQSMPRGGTDLSTSMTDAVNGNYFTWPGNAVLMSFFSPVPCTITVIVPGYVDSVLKIPNLSLVLTPSVVKLWRCLVPDVYVTVGGVVEFDSTVSCSVAIYAD